MTYKCNDVQFCNIAKVLKQEAALIGVYIKSSCGN